jgi:hypothetical protein
MAKNAMTKFEEKDTCENFDKLIANFDRALLRPDASDLVKAKEFVNKVI